METNNNNNVLINSTLIQNVNWNKWARSATRDVICAKYYRTQLRSSLLCYNAQFSFNENKCKRYLKQMEIYIPLLAYLGMIYCTRSTRALPSD